MIYKTSSFSIGFNFVVSGADLDASKKRSIIFIEKFKFIFINFFSIYFSDYYGFKILEISNHKYDVYDKMLKEDINTKFIKSEGSKAMFGILFNSKLMLVNILFKSFVIYFDRKMAKSYKQIIKRLKEEKKKLEVKK